MEKKVLVTATTFPRWNNDTTARFVFDLSNRLASQYKITVLAPHHKGALKKEKMGKLDVMRFAYFKPESLQRLCYGGGIIPNMKKSILAKIQMPLLLISEYFAAKKIIKKEKISMLHAHWILPQGLIGAFLKRKYRIPLLVTIHGSDLFPLKNNFFGRLQRYVAENSDFITVNTEATKKELLRRLPQITVKVKIIPMGVDLNIFRKRAIKKPKKYSKNRILLFAGRLSDQKGLQYLIESMGEILRYDNSVKLLIIGEGPYKKTLLQIVQSKKLEEHVEFLGSMPTEKIARYHNYADIFVMPSLATKTGTEALGLSMLEAMSSGCAVIGTNIGGIPFAVKDGYNGLLVRQSDPHELSNAIIKLLRDRKKAIRLGNNAARFVRKNYSWDKVSREFLKIYEELAK